MSVIIPIVCELSARPIRHDYPVSETRPGFEAAATNNRTITRRPILDDYYVATEDVRIE